MFSAERVARHPDVFVLFYTPGYGKPGVGWTPVLASRDDDDIIWWQAQFQATENLIGYNDFMDTVFRIPFHKAVSSRRTWICSPGGTAVMEKTDGRISTVPRLLPAADGEGRVPALQAGA